MGEKLARGALKTIKSLPIPLIKIHFFATSYKKADPPQRYQRLLDSDFKKSTFLVSYSTIISPVAITLSLAVAEGSAGGTTTSYLNVPAVLNRTLEVPA